MATEWNVEFRAVARRDFKKLDEDVQQDAAQSIADLIEDPYPRDCIELENQPGLFRIYFFKNQYRIVYSVSQKQRKLIVERIRPRGTAYIGLEKKKPRA